ncbi:MAG TPA: sialidase family protein [Ktedonosporobacter sp.]|nr:sialidase family protein [Ktedonosporobacter sp.]
MVIFSQRRTFTYFVLVFMIIVLVLALLFAMGGKAQAASHPLTLLSTDPYTNATSQHKTEVEPDTLAFGQTIVSAFQVGRFFNGGASNIGFATSINGGTTFTHGFLPGTTDKATPPGPYARASDASVAFDPKHNVWIISWLGIFETGNPAVPTNVDVEVSRSTDGGHTWSNPIAVATHTAATNYDKNWSVCDTTPTSPFYGQCYTEFDDNGQGDLVLMSTSRDGGLTWGAPQPTADSTHGLGGQPVVQPSGKVIVPLVDFDLSPFFAFMIGSFTSTDGGTTWSSTVLVSEVDFHAPNGNLRADVPLPSAEMDASGKVYVAWSDCRFESGCAASDIVFSSSPDGVSWTAVKRIPIDRVGSGVDHFLPGLAVDRATVGGAAHLALVYYYYPNTNCTPATCQLNVGFVSSDNAGARWTRAEQLAGPMTMSWLPNTTQGFMVGDYFSTSIAAHSDNATPVFMVAHAPTGVVFDQATYTTAESLSRLLLAAPPLTVGNDQALASSKSLKRVNNRSLTLR